MADKIFNGYEEKKEKTLGIENSGTWTSHHNITLVIIKNQQNQKTKLRLSIMNTLLGLTLS